VPRATYGDRAASRYREMRLTLSTDDAAPVCMQNFNVILTQHNPARDKNVHFIVQPKMTAKDRQLIAQRKVPLSALCPTAYSVTCERIVRASPSVFTGCHSEGLHAPSSGADGLVVKHPHG
jgi:hypothetical protein